MPTMISGQTRTNSVNASSLRIDMDDVIKMLDPDMAPFSYIMSSNGVGSLAKKFHPGQYNGITLQKGQAKSFKTEWLEDEMDQRTDAINYGSGYNTTAQTLAVDNASYFIAGMVVRNNKSGELMRVNSVGASDIVVTRNLNQNGSGYAITDNDELLIIGDAEAEGAAAPTAKSTDLTPLYNYTQIMRKVVDFSNTQLATDTYGGDKLVRQQQKKGLELLQDLERSLLFGTRYRDTSTTGYTNHMGGVNYYVTTNVTDVNGVLSQTAWETWLRNIFNYGGGERLILCSPVVISAVSNFAANRLMTSVKDDTFGVSITKYSTPHGDVKLVRQPVFKGSTTAGIGGHAMALDMKNVQLMHLNNNGIDRSPHLQTNIQNPNVDGRQDAWLTESTLKITNEKRHGILTRVTG